MRPRGRRPRALSEDCAHPNVKSGRALRGDGELMQNAGFKGLSHQL